MDATFNALVISENAGQYVQKIKQIAIDKLPDNDLLIKVHYSSVNYKDALSSSGNKGVTKHYPHVPGVDAAGVVIESKSALFKTGDEVIVTGYDLGMDTWGGFGEYISIPAAWAVPLPKGLSLYESMIYGTAGFTAALSVYQIINAGITPSKGEIAVSGATGGVGSIAVAILNKIGFNTTAISGKNDPDFLNKILGARQFISREEFVNKHNSRALHTPIFAAGVDTVGGEVLSGIIKSVQYSGVVTCCGMVASPELLTSIFPFILRGVCLTGIDSVQAPMSHRIQIWQLMASGWKPANLTQLSTQITLEQLPDALNQILKGQAKGRFVLKHNV
ncbi:YhdH/YhfP family quinone oxidoreductase [uncultured Mucilaginibacter sp.]|uniref:YhdH/YhfP family quinone oxidoreductase n=1 Tax=uncultured Mucilaginibacter sp. TaxID=797541 RepID=UPI0025FF8EAD|nr:YhdH/YhfP family quinone oxidoreductase [uncultured Mucilaginibacter sp.]